jgi:hypothetical protein
VGEKNMKPGRKFIGLLIAFALLLLGLVIVNALDIDIEFYNTYAKWIIIGLGIFTGGNAGITVSSFIKNQKNEDNQYY